MSIICENRHGWVVDHLVSVSSVYQKTQCYADISCLKSKVRIDHLPEVQKLHKESEDKCGSDTLQLSVVNTETRKQQPTDLRHLEMTSEETKTVTVSFAFNSDLFAIHHPYMMDTQFQKIQQLTTDPGHLPIKRKRKRKSNHENQCGEDKTKDVCHRLKSALNSLVDLARCQGHLNDPACLPLDNNLSARSAGRIRADDLLHAHLCEQWEHSSCHREPLVLKGNRCYSGCDMVNRRVENPQGSVVVRLTGEGEEGWYLIPASCRFMLSSMAHFLHDHHQLAVEGGYDLIVIDPPWQNKSVKRKKSYCVLSEDEIRRLPIPQLAAPGCLVAVWTTNKSRVRRFVSQLLPAWNVRHFVTWYWLKVTTRGVPISSIDSTHKQPYEMLVLGRTSSDGTAAAYRDLPEEKTVISVPCSLHSKKPPLLDLLSPYLPDRPRCLELFARNLWPGWTSWGNEVLQHQHIDFYTQLTDRPASAPDCERHSERHYGEAVVK